MGKVLDQSIIPDNTRVRVRVGEGGDKPATEDSEDPVNTSGGGGEPDPVWGESLSEASLVDEETSTPNREEEPEPAESGQGGGNTVATTNTGASNFFVIAPLTALLACPGRTLTIGVPVFSFL